VKIKNLELKSASRTGQQGDEGSGGLVDWWIGGLVDWWMVGWLDGWMAGAAGAAGAGARCGMGEPLCKWALLRSAYAKAAARRAGGGRTPPKGGSEVFPYWSRRIPTCVAVVAHGHHGKAPSVQAPTARETSSTKGRRVPGRRATWLKNMKLRNEPILKMQESPDFTDVK